MSINRDLEDESSSYPHLPPELEQEIFLYAIENEITDVPNFFLVSKRIHECLLPIVFKVVVVFHSRVFPSPFPFHQPTLYTYYGSHIQHLLICNSSNGHSRRMFKELSPVLHECLLQCPNLTDLALWCPQAPVATFTGLKKLTHLSLDVKYLLKVLSPLNSGNITTTPGTVLFPNITHLNLLLKVSIATPECESFIRNLDYHLPALTHLAHSQFLWDGTGSTKTLLEFTLRTLWKLRVWILWRSGSHTAVRLDERQQSELPIQDARLVALVIVWEKAWEQEAKKTGFGIWTFADKVVEERENGRTT